MDKLLDLIDGYKTKIAAVTTAAFGVAAAFGYAAPNWFIFMLAGFGLYSIRDAVAKLEEHGGEEDE